MDLILDWNAEELAEFRRAIEDRLTELSADLARGASGTETVALDQQSIGRLSRQDALLNQAMSQAQQARRGSEIKGLQAALHRLDEGEYGYCEDCGEAIAQGRLALNLTATRCISCAGG